MRSHVTWRPRPAQEVGLLVCDGGMLPAVVLQSPTIKALRMTSGWPMPMSRIGLPLLVQFWTVYWHAARANRSRLGISPVGAATRTDTETCNQSDRQIDGLLVSNVLRPIATRKGHMASPMAYPCYGANGRQGKASEADCLCPVAARAHPAGHENLSWIG